MNDFFNARDVIKVGDKEYVLYRLDALEKAGLTSLRQLPFSIRIVLEAALRQCNDKEITQTDVKNIAAWTPKGLRPGIPFFTGARLDAGFHRRPRRGGPRRDALCGRAPRR